MHIVQPFESRYLAFTPAKNITNIQDVVPEWDDDEVDVGFSSILGVDIYNCRTGNFNNVSKSETA